MSELNLPECQLKFSSEEGKATVWDQVRMKYVAFTPEENVRQHFVNYLIARKGFPASHLMNEVTLNLNGLTRRCDTVAYDRQLQPKVIVEYKAPSVQIDRKVFNQISRYDMVLKVDWLIVSNGLKHYCLKRDCNDGTYSFQSDIPSYSDI